MIDIFTLFVFCTIIIESKYQSKELHKISMNSENKSKEEQNIAKDASIGLFSSKEDIPRGIRTCRPNIDEYFLSVAEIAASRSTCRHRWQGAVIVKDKQIIATGYNGAPPNSIDCLQHEFCHKAEGLPCLAEGLHGESNAIISAAKNGISIDGATMYCVYSPCLSCCNMIKVAGIKCVVYREVYSNFPTGPAYLCTMMVDAIQLMGANDYKINKNQAK